MKSIFNYATKELSQDAFLRWLFENYNCENEVVKKICERVFRKFTKEQLEFSDITYLTTKAQWKHIDVSIWFTIKGENYLIAIEDKINSQEHRQLENYNNSILNQQQALKDVYKIFYKTALIDDNDLIKDNEKNRVDKAGWTIFDINDIYKLFCDICDTNSEILDGYVDYVKKIHKYYHEFKTLDFNKDWLWNNTVFLAYASDKWGNDHTGCYNGIYVYAWKREEFKKFTIELLFEFRHWEIVAKIQYWKNDNERSDLIELKEYLKKLKIDEPFSNDTVFGKKILARIVKKPEEGDFFTSYEEFDKWVGKCEQSFAQILEQIKNDHKDTSDNI